MNILELQEKVLNLRSELKGLIENGESEKRELNEEETKRMEEIRNEMDAAEAEIKSIEKENEKIEREIKNKENKKENRKTMSLIKMINAVVEGRQFDENEASAIASAKEEMRKSGLSTKGQIVLRTLDSGGGNGGDVIETEKMPLESAIRANLVASKIGCQWISGLVGNIDFPYYDGTSVLWKGETDSAEEGDGATDFLSLKPKRLTTVVNLSKQLLLQESSDVEAIIIRDIAEAVANKLDETIFGDGERTETNPGGIFHSHDAIDNIANLDYSMVLDAEKECEERNIHNYIFVVNPSVKFQLKATQMANGLQMVWNGNEIDGQKAISSNSVLKNSFAVFDPSKLVVAQWGGIDILVDPYTKADEGCIRLVLNAYFDAEFKYTGAPVVRKFEE